MQGLSQNQERNYRHRRFTAWLGERTLKLLGWQVSGELPQIPKFVLIGAHHTSNWDFVLLLALKFKLHLNARWFAKHSLFRWPFGALLRRLGGVPIKRHVQSNVVGQAIDEFKQRQEFILAITPEGTRKKVERWKTGFYHIARGADVPVVFVALDYARRTLVLAPGFALSGDEAKDMQDILAFYRPFRPKKPEFALALQ